MNGYITIYFVLDVAVSELVSFAGFYCIRLHQKTLRRHRKLSVMIMARRALFTTSSTSATQNIHCLLPLSRTLS